MKRVIKKIIPYTDIFLFLLVYPSGLLLKLIRKAGIHRLPKCKNALLNVGVFPITNHYYEPQFDMRNMKPSFSQERNLPGIDWNIEEQTDILKQLTFADFQ